jgi:tRNA A-37 threonylcarbamoyl transferase component Bud32
MYIMDDVRMGIPGARMKSLGDSTPTRSLWKKVLDKVEEFHRIAGGQHGDLHDHNIMVVKTNGKTSIKIIDYGAFRSYKELRNIGHHVSYHRGMKVYNLGNGQNFIKNKNWLKHILNGSTQTPQSEYLL